MPLALQSRPGLAWRRGTVALVHPSPLSPSPPPHATYPLSHPYSTTHHPPTHPPLPALISHVIRYNATDAPYKQAALPQHHYPRWGVGGGAAIAELY